MSGDRVPIEIRIEMEVRVTYPAEPGKLARVLKVLRESGGRLHAHLVYRLYEKAAAFFICERPSEAALALQEDGVDVETETVVTIRTRDRPGLLGHLVQTLEAEGIDVGYSFATAGGDGVLLVFRTGDNPRTEDVLRSYLLPSEGA
jgi:hypothetical protein